MFQKTQFKPIPERPNFPKEEEEVLQYWEEIDAFKQQLEKTKNNKPYTFYDGPPFATGLPHYGNLLAGTIKDIACRYASQTGHYVERRFGWDCHGLPVEFEIDKKLGITDRNQVLEMGIDKYNAECRSIVMRYSNEWRKIVGRFGRWIDFDNDYKTLDLSFMESIWAVFKIMFEKGLVYKGCKVMPYSNGCSTVLSNFEAQQNYKDVVDPSLIVTFPLESDPKTKFCAWTTTPWTLPVNLALCVHPDFDYVKVLDKKTGDFYILAECRLSELYGNKKDGYEIKEKMKGKTLENIKYVPLFDFLVEEYPKAHTVCCDTYVTSDTGTGVVHQSPGFGADDYNVCLKYGIINADNPPVPLDAAGRYTSQISTYEGQYVKDADKNIRKDLTTQKRLISDKTSKHNYPFCWRSDKPLIYKAIHCWFIDVPKIKQQLIDNNKKPEWVPKFAQEGRFNNWLKDAREWCFSRNRFWGNPIPIWSSDDGEEIVCVGSVEELKKLTGVETITDLHRESIDHLTIPSKQGKGELKRIEEVFDCWFESGSMPFASVHWPFSCSDEELMKKFPADFIAEGLDQTRGWFYTLNVIATAIKDDTPYKNLIVNGIVQAEDGKKMSKSKGNYPDPLKVASIYGADAIRLYMINSGLVRAESLNFKEEGVNNTIKDVFLPLYNSYRFLFQNITRLELNTEQNFIFDEKISEDLNNLTNVLDKWIIGANQNLIKLFREEMKHYRFYTVIPKLLAFLEDLTNTYIKLNRPRIKGDEGLEQQKTALSVLYNVLLKTTIMLAPFTPFIAEMFYTNLKRVLSKDSKYLDGSVHFINIPEFNPSLIDETLEQNVNRMNRIITLSRALRIASKTTLNNKQPVESLTLIQESAEWLESMKPLLSYIEQEVNVGEVILETNFLQYVERKATLKAKEIAQQFKSQGKNFPQELIVACKNLTLEQVQALEKSGSIEIEITEKDKKKKTSTQSKHTLKVSDFELGYSYKSSDLGANKQLGGESEFSLLIDVSQSESLKLKGAAREFISAVQKLRKSSGVQIEDNIIIFYELLEGSDLFKQAVKENLNQITSTIKKPVVDISQKQDHLLLVKNGSQSYTIDGQSFNITLCEESLRFDLQALENTVGKQNTDIVAKILASQIQPKLKTQVQNNGGKYSVKIENNQYNLTLNKEFFFDWQN